MPIIQSAIKRMKQTAKRNERNVGIKRDIKTAVKAFMAKPSQKTLSDAQSEIDTAVKKKLIKKNTASRRKANLAKVAKENNVKLGATIKPAAKPVATKTTDAKKPIAKASAVKAPAKKPAAAKKPTAKKTTK